MFIVRLKADMVSLIYCTVP